MVATSLCSRFSEERHAKWKQYNKDHREQRKAYNRRYWREHKERLQEYHKKYRQNHLQEKRDYYRNHVLASPKLPKRVYGLHKRPYFGHCEICGKSQTHPGYHHWNNENPSLGVWVCMKCHWIVESLDNPEFQRLAKIYLNMKEHLLPSPLRMLTIIQTKQKEEV